MGSKLNLLWDHFRFYVLDAVGMLFCRYAIGKGKLLLVRLDAIGDFVVFLDRQRLGNGGGGSRQLVERDAR